MDPLIAILTKPDNIPILMIVPATIVLTTMWWSAARKTDALLEKGGVDAVREAMEGTRPAQGDDADPDLGRVHTWPYLVRIELIWTLAVILIVVVWSIVIDAPLEQQADPTRTPNPSKAPWYFLGLQEMLVYFDPWIAGVALPLLIIGGLCAIPYLDVNPKGVGYYGWRERKFAIATYMFGFLILWLLLIIIGVACRGPGWNWFWPWEAWDPHRVVATPNRNLSDLVGVHSATAASIFGGIMVFGYYGIAYVYWRWRKGTSETLNRMGAVRYGITAFLFLTMMALPIKMGLRLALGVKYVWVTPWFNV